MLAIQFLCDYIFQIFYNHISRSPPLYHQLNLRILGTHNATPIVTSTKIASVIIVIELPKVESNCPTHKNLKCGDALTGNNNLPT